MKHILFILKQREEAQQYTEWVLKEALNGRNLHSGGTFQNVLARKLDEIIVPIFVAILSSVDNYSNLEIMGDRYENWINPNTILNIVFSFLCTTFKPPLIYYIFFLSMHIGITYQSKGYGLIFSTIQEFLASVFITRNIFHMTSPLKHENYRVH